MIIRLLLFLICQVSYSFLNALATEVARIFVKTIRKR
jgi:hypothetical protein